MKTKIQTSFIQKKQTCGYTCIKPIFNYMYSIFGRIGATNGIDFAVGTSYHPPPPPPPKKKGGGVGVGEKFLHNHETGPILFLILIKNPRRIVCVKCAFHLCWAYQGPIQRRPWTYLPTQNKDNALCNIAFSLIVSNLIHIYHADYTYYAILDSYEIHIMGNPRRDSCPFGRNRPPISPADQKRQEKRAKKLCHEAVWKELLIKS